jgi:Ca-activated chloride channel family protein
MDNIGENDTVSIVTYASGVRVVADGVNGSNKEELVEAVMELEAYGSTNGSGGIHKAYRLAEKYFIENGNNRVLLATDGDFNVGVTTEGELERLISHKRKSGVYLSVFGFGMGNTKHNKMETLASNGNGNAYYIDNLLEAKKVFVEELGGVLNTVANDTKIQIEFNSQAVKEYRLLGYENKLLTEEEFNNSETDAGEIGSGHTTIAMYEIVPTKKFLASDYIFKSILRYKDSKTMEQIEEIKEINNIGLVSENDYIFASCVVEFGLLLRNSSYKGNASYNNLFERLNLTNVINDYYKEEFKELVTIMSDK